MRLLCVHESSVKGLEGPMLQEVSHCEASDTASKTNFSLVGCIANVL